MKSIMNNSLHHRNILTQRTPSLLIKIFGILVLLMLCALSFSQTTHAIMIKDDRGVTVQFAQSPKRIISILPSLTETVCALGQCQRLVGVDRYSNFPESVKSLAQVGGGLDPNIEAIVALKPDVVLMSKASRIAERLNALGIKVVALESQTSADAKRVFHVLAQLLEVNDAEQIWRVIDLSIAAAAQSIPSSAKKFKVYFEVSSAPYAAGESSFIGETLQGLGLGNIVPSSLGPFPKLNPEFIVRANPDVIMMGASGFAALSARPGWSNIRAIKENKVCLFNSAEIDILVRPGPRMADAARVMAECIRRISSSTKQSSENKK
jgi:iron complex transport system substrate-binding protein